MNHKKDWTEPIIIYKLTKVGYNYPIKKNPSWPNKTQAKFQGKCNIGRIASQSNPSTKSKTFMINPWLNHIIPSLFKKISH
jgi:hypothetical protein